MKNNTINYPSFYFLKDTVLNYIHSKGYEETDIGDFLLDDEDSMKMVELDSVALIKTDCPNDILTVKDVIEKAYDNEMDFYYDEEIKHQFYERRD